MTTESKTIQSVPTNVITGFLGVGKTSAILNWLRDKPDNERWAVLVNEFGEIGVDASLMGNHDSDQVFISEVPGGCMCCTSGLPMQIALNQLLMRAKPDRLLIEPTGLGHPKEVLQALSSEHYREALSLRSTITLVDARKLADPRYTDSETFNEQIQVADCVIGNKADLYGEPEREHLVEYVSDFGIHSDQVMFAEHSQIPQSVLCGPAQAHQPAAHSHAGFSQPLASAQPMPESGFIKASNQGQGFVSTGWRFAGDRVFDQRKLQTLMMGIDAERIKAVFITNGGIVGFNYADGALTQMPIDDCLESRIEVISVHEDMSLEGKLLSCLA